MLLHLYNLMLLFLQMIQDHMSFETFGSAEQHRKSPYPILQGQIDFFVCNALKNKAGAINGDLFIPDEKHLV